jgi:GntR family transcriptional regulator
MGTVNKDLPIPLYHQVKDLLLEAIEAGHWASDQQLPNESKLAELFGVSKITVRQALQELADLGYIRREQGRGTFVSKPKFGQGPRELMSFTEEMNRHQLAASSRVLEKSVTEADLAVAEHLQLLMHAPVLVLKRLRLADGEPMGIQTAHIPLDLVPGLAYENFESVSLYDLLQTRYGVQAARSREQYFAMSADAESAVLLGIAAGAAVFAAERITYTKTGTPFEFTKSIMRGDRYSIVLNLEKGR